MGAAAQAERLASKYCHDCIASLQRAGAMLAYWLATFDGCFLRAVYTESVVTCCATTSPT